MKRQRAEKEKARAQKEHEEAARQAYRDYLRARVKEQEKEAPEEYRAFLEDSAAKRAELEKGAGQKGRQVTRILLRVFDDEQSYLERFRDFFNELPFEEWLIQQPKGEGCFNLVEP